MAVVTAIKYAFWDLEEDKRKKIPSPKAILKSILKNPSEIRVYEKKRKACMKLWGCTAFEFVIKELQDALKLFYSQHRETEMNALMLRVIMDFVKATIDIFSERRPEVLGIVSNKLKEFQNDEGWPYEKDYTDLVIPDV